MFLLQNKVRCMYKKLYVWMMFFAVKVFALENSYQSLGLAVEKASFCYQTCLGGAFNADGSELFFHLREMQLNREERCVLKKWAFSPDLGSYYDTPEYEIPLPYTKINFSVFSNDASLFAFFDSDSNMNIFDIKQNKLILDVANMESCLSADKFCGAFSLDKQYLVTAEQNKKELTALRFFSLKDSSITKKDIPPISIDVLNAERIKKKMTGSCIPIKIAPCFNENSTSAVIVEWQVGQGTILEFFTQHTKSYLFFHLCSKNFFWTVNSAGDSMVVGSYSEDNKETVLKIINFKDKNQSKKFFIETKISCIGLNDDASKLCIVKSPYYNSPTTIAFFDIKYDGLRRAEYSLGSGHFNGVKMTDNNIILFPKVPGSAILLNVRKKYYSNVDDLSLSQLNNTEEDSGTDAELLTCQASEIPDVPDDVHKSLKTIMDGLKDKKTQDHYLRMAKEDY